MSVAAVQPRAVRATSSPVAEAVARASIVPLTIEQYLRMVDAHSSLERDREDKLPIYAAASVPQYVIINLFNDTVEVYTDPDPTGEQYRTKTALERADTLALQLPEGDLQIPVADVLP